MNSIFKKEYKVKINGDVIEITHGAAGFGFHPLDLSVEDRMKMIRALSTKE